MRADRVAVCFGGVAFVAGKAVVRIDLVVFKHHAVTGHLGHNAGARNGHAFRIPFDHTFNFIWNSTLVRIAINENFDFPVNGKMRHQSFYSRGHGQMRGTQNVHFVNNLLAYDADAHNGAFMDLGKCLFALDFRQGLGITDAASESEILDKNSRSDHRPGQGTTPCFIDPKKKAKAITGFRFIKLDQFIMTRICSRHLFRSSQLSHLGHLSCLIRFRNRIGINAGAPADLFTQIEQLRALDTAAANNLKAGDDR
jgi:hypothetical protein